MKKLIFSFVLLIFIFDIYSQVKEYNLPPNNFYNNSKVLLLKFKKFEAINLSINNDSIYFKNKLNQSNEKFAIDEINYLRVQEGNHAGAWAVYGGLTMGAVCLLAILQVEVDPTHVLKENTGVICAGFIAVGVVSGALIGAASPRWKTYYIHRHVGFLESVNFDLYSDYRSTGVKVKFLIE